MHPFVNACFGPFTLVACFLAVATVAEEVTSPPATNEPTVEQIKRVITFIESPDATYRASAYKACREKGDAFKETYAKILEKAQETHAKRLEDLAQAQYGAKSVPGEMVAAWEEWKSLAEPALAFVQVDHEKEEAKMEEMDGYFAKAEKAWERVRDLKKRGSRLGNANLTGMEGPLNALREIHKEKAWCQPDEFLDEEDLDLAFFEETLFLHGGWSERLEVIEEINHKLSELEKVQEANDTETWANATQKEFARLLNNRRAALGLEPLRIEEKLSAACIGHSTEMIALSYFSHTSPVEENETFGKRAQKAGFAGAPSGECIFSGSASASAAEKAWWYSDGHRLINYSSGPNTLGIGPVGTMWTLNTGSVSQ